MNIYIICATAKQPDISDFILEGVFSTREAAEEHLARLEAAGTLHQDFYYSIGELTLDLPNPTE